MVAGKSIKLRFPETQEMVFHLDAQRNLHFSDIQLPMDTASPMEGGETIDHDDLVSTGYSPELATFAVFLRRAMEGETEHDSEEFDVIYHYPHNKIFVENLLFELYTGSRLLDGDSFDIEDDVIRFQQLGTETPLTGDGEAMLNSLLVGR